MSTKPAAPPPPPRPLPVLSASAAFSVLLVARLLSAAYATIPDCDEVFNFWEPAHYLAHGHGLQTWEYSPEFAIRSWAYVGLHALAGRAVALLPGLGLGLGRAAEFYGLRALLAVFCAYSETQLYAAVSRAVDRRVGLLYLVFTACAAGMFHAAAAFLPSSFAMYTTMLGSAAFLRRQTVLGVFWFALGGLLGWPFSLAMCVPFVAEALVAGARDGRLPRTLAQLASRGGAVSVLLLGAIVAVDSAAYRAPAVVPLNIVLYNVFGGAGRGPAIYGTEPWWFYLANLALNFNLLLPLALAAAPLGALHAFCVPASCPAPRALAAAVPFYLWLAVFTAQPHKEERFMFVLYPALCLNAALALHAAAALWGGVSARVFGAGPVHTALGWAALVLPAVGSAGLSLSRALAITTAYSAPLHIYAALAPSAHGTLCLAKEWYRFPSHYLLPAGVRARFVRSAFDGLVPGAFAEGVRGRGATWMVPVGMNDRNEADAAKYVTLSMCDYVVESYFDRETDAEEPGMALGAQWEALRCERFLDAAGTPTAARALWVPGTAGARRWGRYCLFARREGGEGDVL